jgi:hypothetical protein
MLKYTAAALSVTLAGLACSVHAQAADRHVRIINETSYSMLHFYASNTIRTSWEEDILGLDVLRPGETVRVNIDDGTGRCMFDLRAEFPGGKFAERCNVNVCTAATWTITP